MSPPTTEQMLFIQTIYERYRGVIYKIAMSRTRDDAEADDVVSEALLRLFRNAETLRKLHEKQLIDYIADTLRSVAGDLDRRRRRDGARLVRIEEEFDAPDTEPGPEEAFVEQEGEQALLRHLRETLLELRETDRLLLVGKYMEGASDEELAQQLGVQPASVRMKLTRARARARRILERKEAGGDA